MGISVAVNELVSVSQLILQREGVEPDLILSQQVLLQVAEEDVREIVLLCPSSLHPPVPWGPHEDLDTRPEGGRERQKEEISRPLLR